MEHEGHTRQLGDRVAGDVVLGRTEPAAHQHHVGARGGESERRDDPLLVVADGLVVHDVHADLGETLRHPLGVRVGDLPEQQLGADRDDLRSHDAATRCRVVMKYSTPE